MSDHVFICYARDDEAFVLQLGEKLKGRGVPVWLDQWDIPPGSDWDRSIDDAIYDCGKFIIVLSPQAVESTEVRGELRTALDENKRIIPVIHSTCRVPRQLRTIQHVDFTTRGPDDESALKQLLRTLETSINIRVARQVEATDKTVQEAERARAEPEAKKKEELRRAQAEHAAKTHLPPGTVFRDRVRDGSQGPEMVLVPAGTFKMGDIQGKGDDFEKPVHSVSIPKPFAMGRFQITFEEYDRFASATSRPLPNDRGWGRGRQPVINVSWEDAVEYSKWLSEQTDKQYRLPTESEWEYAARAGTETAYWWGNEITPGMANFAGTDNSWDGKQTSPVGSFKPNPFGLYDTAGNVWESVQDSWHENYKGAPTDGSAWEEKDDGQRVIRGGSWGSRPGTLRSSNRGRGNAGSGSGRLGFRLAQDLE